MEHYIEWDVSRNVQYNVVYHIRPSGQLKKRVKIKLSYKIIFILQQMYTLAELYWVLEVFWPKIGVPLTIIYLCLKMLNIMNYQI